MLQSEYIQLRLKIMNHLALEPIAVALKVEILNFSRQVPDFNSVEVVVSSRIMCGFYSIKSICIKINSSL